MLAIIEVSSYLFLPTFALFIDNSIFIGEGNPAGWARACSHTFTFECEVKHSIILVKRVLGVVFLSFGDKCLFHCGKFLNLQAGQFSFYLGVLKILVYCYRQ